MSTSASRARELQDSQLQDERAYRRKHFCDLLRVHEKDLSKAAWALCDRDDFMEYLLESALLSTFEELSRPLSDQPFRFVVARKLIDAARILREGASPPAESLASREARELSSELSAQVHQALKSLSSECREAFVLRDVMSFTAIQCAEILHINAGEARQLISDARLRMAQQLSGAVSSRAVGGGR